MAKKPRPPRLEKSCPLPTTHTRLHQVHEQWHRVAADYGEPDDFVTSLNAALVSLRSVSFMLNKEKSKSWTSSPGTSHTSSATRRTR